jgi:RNA polymerase sigma factor (sigma-70 family)
MNLIASRKQDDTQGIDKLYIDHVHDLYAYASGLGFDRETILDAIHDVFYRLCLHPELLDKVSNPRFFLLHALRNRLIDALRTRKPYTDLSNTKEELSFMTKVTIEDEYIHSEDDRLIAAKVEALLQKLSPREREIVYLRYMQGCSFDEIAILLDKSPAACYRLLYKAISKLKGFKVNLFLLLLLLN